MEKDEPQRTLIVDAGPVIHLHEIDCLDLLDDFENVLVPEQVWSEIKTHRPQALSHPGLTQRTTPWVVGPELRKLIRFLALDEGEQAALVLLSVFPQATFLTDDAAARVAALTLGYKVHGTIGILLRAIRRQQRTREEVLALLGSLPHASSLHIRVALLEEIIAEVRTSKGGD